MSEHFDRLAAIIKARTPGPWHVRDEIDVDSQLDGDERYCEWLAEITARDEDPTEYLTLSMQCCGLVRFAKPNADFIAALGSCADELMAVVEAIPNGMHSDTCPANWDSPCICRMTALYDALAALDARLAAVLPQEVKA